MTSPLLSRTRLAASFAGKAKMFPNPLIMKNNFGKISLNTYNV